MFDTSNPMLLGFARSASPALLQQKLTTMAEAMDPGVFAKRVAGETVARTRPDRAVPGTHAHYRSLVCDGIEFFLSRIDSRRLVDLVVDQLKMDPAAGSQARLTALAGKFPTLHKLGQIIARHPDIDPSVKAWLVQLENGQYGTPEAGVLERIHCQLQQSDARQVLHIEPALLSEASVGAVVAFEYAPSPGAAPRPGVFKVLKPGIRRHLKEELKVLKETAAFLEDHRDRYPLKNFRFREIFQDVVEMLVKEIDLASEQVHLTEAARFYNDMDGVCVPRCLPFGTGEMTAMTYLCGAKITDADLSADQRRKSAALLFEALVCRPLFSRLETALFHGDPHAGNILAAVDTPAGAPRIGLLDWSLAGRLAKGDRVKTVQLIQAIFKKDIGGICDAVMALANGPSSTDPIPRPLLRRLILGLMRESGFARQRLVKKTFRLLEALAREGMVFPADLMLFRKAIFTLEGVLHDLWPSFDMDAAVIRYLTALMGEELPIRLGNLLFPLTDRPENYPSLISNAQLQSLMVHQYTAALQICTQTWVGSLMPWRAISGVPHKA